MKKLLGCFLCVMLLVFGLAASVQAFPIDITTDSDVPNTNTDPAYVNYNFWDSQGATFIGSSADLWNEGWTTEPAGNDKLVNINEVLDLAGLDPIIDGVPDLELEGTPKFGSINVSGYNYVTLKWDGVFGLWDVNGLDSFSFGEEASPALKWGLSHYGLWNSVPEPATMFLLGTGLIVLAGFGRKKYIKG